MGVRRVLLIQLPIPQPGMQPPRNNIPLAAGYLALFARRQGLGSDYDIDILPARLTNTLGDCGLVAAILGRQPWLVGFTCYLWNVERTLWIARRLKERRPDLLILLGGPEITSDNAWVLDRSEVDLAVHGEGEQTFAELLASLRTQDRPPLTIDGLSVLTTSGGFRDTSSGERGSLVTRMPPRIRRPLSSLDAISSPYIEGMLDAADEQTMFLETLRGCLFKCKFCYYPKAYDRLYSLSEHQILANLEHAQERGVREVVLLDPTLNQGRDFSSLLQLLARGNPARQFTYSGELRAEGITPEIARLMKAANFAEVEIGLQSTNPVAMQVMDRKNNLRLIERGVRALLDVGIHVRMDLIIGLPGDTAESVRTSLLYVPDTGLYSDVQVFNLSILPGTEFRQDADRLGLKFQARPPYYVLQTPQLRLQEIYGLMAEAEDLFDTEFDPLPPPELPDLSADRNAPCVCVWLVELDLEPSQRERCANASQRAQAFTVWLRATDFGRHHDEAAALVTSLVAENPHTTLQIVLEPAAAPRSLTSDFLESLRRASLQQPSYLDQFYSLLPGRPKGAKRLVIVLSASYREQLKADWIERMTDHAALVWCGGGLPSEELTEHEFVP